MRSRTFVRGAALAAAALLVGGCTVHPAGEREERHAAANVGRWYADAQPLPADPTVDDLVRTALQNNADVERLYWEWRAALEQVPLDGTQATNLTINGAAGISHGRTSPGQATLGVGNDPMADLVLPNKLDASARRALELARAAGQRFRQAQLDLRANVIAAYDDYALQAEVIRLDRQNADLLATIVSVTEARNRAGAAGELDVLKAENELDIARNDIATATAEVPAERAALNALLNRPADAPLTEPARLPAARALALDSADLLAAITRHNPRLVSLTDEAKSRRVGIEVARLLFEPDFSVNAGTDLQGIAQTAAGMVTVPLLKYEAIRAAVKQAEDNLQSAELARRQSQSDLDAQAIADFAIVRDADRQLDLYEHSLLPRARELTELSRSSYETGNASLLDVLDSQRSLLLLQRVVADLRVTRDKRLAGLESLAGGLNTRDEPSASDQGRHG